MAPVINSIRLPTKRPFSWRALGILVVLQLLGNLLSIPTLMASNLPVEPLLNWIIFTALSIPIIVLALFLGTRIGLGAPLLEGYLDGRERRRWARTVVAISVLVAVAATPLILLVNLNVDPDGYPAIWKLVLAAVDAGVQEEIFNRLFLMTGLAWVGSFFRREPDGRPSESVLWIAILISGILFGWAHVDDKLSIPGVPFTDYLILMAVSTLYGIVFGWLYWKLGIECAILAHFAIDALAAGIIVPAYISQNLYLQLLVLIGIVLVGAISWLVLKRAPGDSQQLPPMAKP
jgi:membrane protease YdiL (CAAX protease family)